MKDFIAFQSQPSEYRRELDELGQWLAGAKSLDETKDIQPFFKARWQLSASLGALNSEIITVDRIAFEYDLFGDFACDLMVGDSVRGEYCFIEFEDAGPRSVFVRRGKRSTPEWSPRLDHGFSQIIDWFWKLDDMGRTDDFRARFGGGAIHYNALLVVGRGRSFGPREDGRRRWRRNNVVVHSKHVIILTFDELYEALRLRLQNYGLSQPLPG